MASDIGSREPSDEDVLRLSADIVAAYVAENTVPPGQIADLVRSVHGAMTGLGQAEAAPASRPSARSPRCPIRRSVQHDYIVCLEDGKKLKMLKRYLRSRYNLSPEDYRRHWGLPADYPMVAPAYAQRRSDFAKQIGLGKGVRRK